MMLMPAEQSPLAARTAWEKCLCLLLVVLCLGYVETVFFHFALNAGQADDFVDALWFFEIYRSQPDLWSKLAVLVLPNHEHITLFNHLVYLCHYWLVGEINFFHYMLIGQLIVIACCLVLAAWLKTQTGWWYALALAFGLFFNLFYWHAGFWAMTALSNQAVILFALLAAYAAARKPAAIVVPLCWALLAAASQFNGLLVLPALLMASVVAALSGGEKRWCQWLVWGIGWLLLAGLYIAYENPFAADHLWRFVEYTDPGRLADYAKPAAPDVALDARSFLNLPLTWLSVSGATVFNLSAWLPAVLVGSVLLLVLLYVAVVSRRTPDRFWWTMLAFVLASTLLIAIGRGLWSGPDIGLLYRYRLYPFLLLVLLVGGLLQVRPSIAGLRSTVLRSTVLRCSLLAILLVQVSSLHVLDDIAEERHNIKISHYYYLIDGGLGRSQMPFYPHNQDWRLFNALQQGYYSAYEAIDAVHKPAAVSVVDRSACPDSAAPAPGSILAWSKKPRALAVEISLVLPSQTTPLEILFCGQDAAYQLTLDERNIERAHGLYAPQLLLKKQLPPAQYRAYWRESGGQYFAAGEVAFP